MGDRVLLVTGERGEPGLQQIVTCDAAALTPGQHAAGYMLDPDGCVMAEVFVLRLPRDERGRDRFALLPLPPAYDRVLVWLRGLADGYILFDPGRPVREGRRAAGGGRSRCRRIGRASPGAGRRGGTAWICHAGTPGLDAYRAAAHPCHFELRKPYFVGQQTLATARATSAKAEFVWPPVVETLHATSLQRTPLYEWHKAHTRHVIPFAGWEMPVWYTGVLDEHNAVRKAAGLFDVAHMGVFEVSGPHAIEFLDLVVSNYPRWYAPGEAFYAYLFDPDGKVIDDLFIYHRRPDLYQIVVNAANADKDWAWLNAVNRGKCCSTATGPTCGCCGRRPCAT